MNKYCIIVSISLVLLFGTSVTFAAEDLDGGLSEGKVVAFLETNAPEIVAELLELRDDDPEQYWEDIYRLDKKIQSYHDVMGDSPELAESLLNSERLEYQSWKLAERSVDETDKEKQEQSKEELRSVLNQIFDARLYQQEAQMRELEEEVNELKRVVEQRKLRRNEIIEIRFKELLTSEDEILGW